MVGEPNPAYVCVCACVDKEAPLYQWPIELHFVVLYYVEADWTSCSFCRQRAVTITLEALEAACTDTLKWLLMDTLLEHRSRLKEDIGIKI